MERTTFVLPTNHMFIRQVFSDGNAVLYLSKKNMVSAEQKRELPKQIFFRVSEEQPNNSSIKLFDVKNQVTTTSPLKDLKPYFWEREK